MESLNESCLIDFLLQDDPFLDVVSSQNVPICLRHIEAFCKTKSKPKGRKRQSKFQVMVDTSMDESWNDDILYILEHMRGSSKIPKTTKKSSKGLKRETALKKTKENRHDQAPSEHEDLLILLDSSNDNKGPKVDPSKSKVENDRRTETKSKSRKKAKATGQNTTVKHDSPVNVPIKVSDKDSEQKVPVIVEKDTRKKERRKARKKERKEKKREHKLREEQEEQKIILKTSVKYDSVSKHVRNEVSQTECESGTVLPTLPEQISSKVKRQHRRRGDSSKKRLADKLISEALSELKTVSPAVSGGGGKSAKHLSDLSKAK